MRDLTRRSAFTAMTASAGIVATLAAAPGVAAAAAGSALQELTRRLATAPRRRSFSSVPFMLERNDQWDHEASEILLSYRGGPRQAWESSEITAAWPNLMREAMNGQHFAHGHPDFVAVSATHGSAHLALFSQAIWDKYGLAGHAGGNLTRNDFLIERPGTSPADDRQNANGYYGPGNNNIVTLQKRGAVMIACHDSIHAIARGIAGKTGGNPDLVAADLTNNLIPGTILVPSIVAYLVELQLAGFTYAKAA